MWDARKNQKPMNKQNTTVTDPTATENKLMPAKGDRVWETGTQEKGKRDSLTPLHSGHVTNLTQLLRILNAILQLQYSE